MRPAALCLLALSLLTFSPRRALGEPHNGGAAIALYPIGVRVPFVVAPQPDSGALVVFLDTRNNATDVYAQRTDRHGRPTLGAGGRLLWSALQTIQVNSMIPDGAGGAIFTWAQNRGATGQDVLVQRVLADGSLAYPAAGLVVCNAARDQIYPLLVAGTAGSYYVTWADDRANVVGVRDLYVQRLNLAGTPQFVANGIVINTVAFRPSQYPYPSVAADLLGGMLISWHVNAPGGVRAQRVSSLGAMQYGATGAALADPTDYGATILPDGSGGLWAWNTRYSGTSVTPYAHHLTSAGTSSFAPAGIAFHSSVDSYFAIDAVRNASTGCFFLGTAATSYDTQGHSFFRQELDVAGNLLRGPDGEVFSYGNDLFFLHDAGSCVTLGMLDFTGIDGEEITYLQKFAFDGTPAYPGNGIDLGREDASVRTTAIATGATAGGVVFEAHSDGRYASPRNGYFYQCFGQAFDTAGNTLWDDAENPAISSASDAPSDQGGRVRVAWDASAADSPSARTARGYRGWRALGTAAAARVAALRPAADTPFASGGRRYLAHASLYWEMVAESPAAQNASYALTLPTGQDSTAGGNADESFMVEAYDDSLHHWWSGTKVAHSVDNLAPAAPAPFTGQYAAGTAHLHWNPNAETDLGGYRLYRGSSTGFVPGPGNLVASPPDTGWTDAAGAPAVYKLTAVDVHGNESKPATLTPTGALGVGGGPGSALAFALGSRNPARAGATLRLSLPEAARMRVAIYDAAGREVRVLADGEQPAGESALEWTGVDAAGRAVNSGLYFARLESGGRRLTVRLAITR